MLPEPVLGSKILEQLISGERVTKSEILKDLTTAVSSNVYLISSPNRYEATSVDGSANGLKFIVAVSHKFSSSTSKTYAFSMALVGSEPSEPRISKV